MRNSRRLRSGDVWHHRSSLARLCRKRARAATAVGGALLLALTQVRAELPLDSGTGAATAYSTRLLTTNYTGPLVGVR